MQVMPNLSPEFQAALDTFLSRCQEIIDTNHIGFSHITRPVLSVEPGRRYIRIVKTDSQRSAYAFIDMRDGSVLLPESWKTPAKHARGNIFDADPGKNMTPYGPPYLR